MNACLFLSFKYNGHISASERSGLERLLCALPRLNKALIYTPANAQHPYIEEGSPPGLVLQLYFPNLLDLEAVLSRDGHLQALNARSEFPTLASAEIAEQTMLVRSFDVPEPSSHKSGEVRCSYLVSYEGEADDLIAWHSHYLKSHTRCVAMLPGVRELEVYTRLDWVSGSPWKKVKYMLRNKVTFDNAVAFEAALGSPVRKIVRADVSAFPPYSGPTRHIAMSTHLVTL